MRIGTGPTIASATALSTAGIDEALIGGLVDHVRRLFQFLLTDDTTASRRHDFFAPLPGRSTLVGDHSLFDLTHSQRAGLFFLDGVRHFGHFLDLGD